MENSTRKKLIAIVKEKESWLTNVGTLAATTLQFTDHLIAHGVTVQQWIPVSGRLPEHNIPVLTCCSNGVIGIGYTQPASASPDGKVHFYPRIGSDVTHWMPLPQLPKEVRKW